MTVESNHNFGLIIARIKRETSPRIQKSRLPSFVADAPLPRLATVGFPDLGYPGEGLPAGNLHQPGLHVLVRTDIRPKIEKSASYNSEK